MVDVIISFDSEDYLTPEAADAELWWANELHKRDIRGCFQLVGEMVRSLIKNQRHDVIDAIAKHEINCHTDFHSRPPTHPQAIEHMSLTDGISYVLQQEAPCLSTLAETFGRWPVSYCSPGDSWTPATLLAMAKMGLRVFCNDKFTEQLNKPYWFCGMLIASYNLDFQDYYEDYQKGAFQADFNALVDQCDDDSAIILFTHPTRLVTSDFWDKVFAGGKRPPREEWHSAPLREADEIERYKDYCREYLDSLSNNSDIRFIDFATLYAERSQDKKDLDAILQEHDLQIGQEGELPLKLSDHNSFLPSSTFDNVVYDWLPYPEGFSGQSLITQAKQLAWTAGPATLTR